LLWLSLATLEPLPIPNLRAHVTHAPAAVARPTASRSKLQIRSHSERQHLPTVIAGGRGSTPHLLPCRRAGACPAAAPDGRWPRRRPALGTGVRGDQHRTGEAGSERRYRQRVPSVQVTSRSPYVVPPQLASPLTGAQRPQNVFEMITARLPHVWGWSDQCGAMSSTSEDPAARPGKRRRRPRSQPAKRYPTDLTDAQWSLIEPLLPAPASGGRPEKHPRREIVNAILYLDRAGCAWRLLPKCFPPWETVYWHWARWKNDGTTDRVHDRLRDQVRDADGRDFDGQRRDRGLPVAARLRHSRC
jgi:transposase